ncbi:MAG: CGNR zinc finger domain-containing protein [Actinomycetota bacterium]|nr:CGNR zinc finger domain-containing protein [Actinomycetota bacterium]
MATDRDDNRLAAPGDLEIVRDFVNTLDLLPRTEELEDPEDLARWLAEHRLASAEPALGEEDLTRARRLREALRALLLANAGLPFADDAAEAFDEAVASTRLRARAGEAGRIELLPAEADRLDHAIGRLVLIVFAAQENGSWPRLKACAECHWALYDRTKNLSAAWCGPQCGTRVRARRHRRRRREDSS